MLQPTAAQLEAQASALARQLRPSLGSRALLAGAALRGNVHHCTQPTQALARAAARLSWALAQAQQATT